METLKHVLAAVVPVIAFVLLLGWAGDMDFCEQTILRMSQQEYNHVRDSLTKLTGKHPSERDIAHWWAEHHDETLP